MITQLGFLNNLVGTTMSVCFMTMSIGNLNTWSSPVAPKLQTLSPDNPFDYVVPETQISLMSSLLTLGAIIGCWMYGGIADYFGRKTSFILLGVPILAGYLLMIAFRTIEMFCVSRFIQGLGMGGGFSIMTIYLAEVSSKENRGVVMTVAGMFFSVGALTCYVTGPYVTVTIFNAIEIIFVATLLVTSLIFCEESPYFYLMKNQEDLARKSLEIYRGVGYNYEDDIKEMKNQISEQQKGDFIEALKTKSFIRSFIIGIGLVIGQQFTGINAILMYSQSIFNMTNSNLSPEICSIIMAVIQIISGVIVPFLSNKFRRKTILYISGVGMIISEIIIGVFCILNGKFDLNSVRFIPVLTLAVFMCSYNIGFGPYCWLISGEILPIRVRTIAVSFLISVYFIVGFFIAQFFNSFVSAIGIGFVFIFFAACCGFSCLFIKFVVIETVGRTLEDIQNVLNGVQAQNIK